MTHYFLEVRMSIAAATSKLRYSKGCINRTHGGDTYDHKKMKKALRSMDKALVNEQLEDLTEEVRSDFEDEKQDYFWGWCDLEEHEWKMWLLRPVPLRQQLSLR
jgi:hypothetical protein